MNPLVKHVNHLSQSEFKLLIWLLHLCPRGVWQSLNETELMQSADLSRTSLYRAKRGLLAAGLIEVEADAGKTCEYLCKVSLYDAL